VANNLTSAALPKTPALVIVIVAVSVPDINEDISTTWPAEAEPDPAVKTVKL